MSTASIKSPNTLSLRKHSSSRYGSSYTICLLWVLYQCLAWPQTPRTQPCLLPRCGCEVEIFCGFRWLPALLLSWMTSTLHTRLIFCVIPSGPPFHLLLPEVSTHLFLFIGHRLLWATAGQRRQGSWRFLCWCNVRAPWGCLCRTQIMAPLSIFPKYRQLRFLTGKLSRERGTREEKDAMGVIVWWLQSFSLRWWDKVLEICSSDGCK